MKIAILGAGGVRTPLILRSILLRQARLGLTELALMDIDLRHLETIGQVRLPDTPEPQIRISHTDQAAAALDGADFVITTFRVGNMAARVVDEHVPLALGALGQETTGPGGFAMAMRTLPVLLGYIDQMRRYCPQAWLLNFANPSGLLAEAATTVGDWPKTIGICDAPAAMQRVAAQVLGVSPSAVDLDYFGLNHLGWIRAVRINGENVLPGILRQLERGAARIPGLLFSADLLASLGMIPNEYNYYYYHAREAVQNILRAEQTRADRLLEMNERLFADLERLSAGGQDLAGRYRAYLVERDQSYMRTETGQPSEAAAMNALGDEGYAGVALDVIEALTGSAARRMILNVPNHGAINAMGETDVVEIPVSLSAGLARPFSVGAIPDECLGLLKLVKAYEKTTIQAALQGSYRLALHALTIHPLVADESLARRILDGYIARHGALFPRLQ